jgi:hypothetical protein
VFDDLRLSLEEVSVRHAEKGNRMLRKEARSYVCEWQWFVQANSLRGLSNDFFYEAQNRQVKLRDVPKRL